MTSDVTWLRLVVKQDGSKCKLGVSFPSVAGPLAARKLCLLREDLSCCRGSGKGVCQQKNHEVAFKGEPFVFGAAQRLLCLGAALWSRCFTPALLVCLRGRSLACDLRAAFPAVFISRCRGLEERRSPQPGNGVRVVTEACGARPAAAVVGEAGEVRRGWPLVPLQCSGGYSWCG